MRSEVPRRRADSPRKPSPPTQTPENADTHIYLPSPTVFRGWDSNLLTCHLLVPSHTSNVEDNRRNSFDDVRLACSYIFGPCTRSTSKDNKAFRPCVAVYRPHTAHPTALFVPLQGLTVPFFAARAQLKQRHTTTKYPANMDNERKITDHSADALRYLLEMQFSRLEGTRRQGSKMVGVAVSAPWVRPDLQTAGLFFTKNGV